MHLNSNEYKYIIFLFILSKIQSIIILNVNRNLVFLFYKNIFHRRKQGKNNHANIVEIEGFITVFLWITNSICIHLYNMLK